MKAELEQEKLAKCFNFETWISDDNSDYNFRAYISFTDIWHGMRAKGVLLFVLPKLCPISITNRQSISNAYNIVAIKLLSAWPPVNSVTVFRASWASASSSKAFFVNLDRIFSTTTNGVLVGDFNIPEIDQFLCSKKRLFISSTLCHLQALIDYRNLIIINKKPTRGNAILDLEIVT